MTRREQIIVVLMILAVLYGVYALFATQGAGTEAMPDMEAQLQEANKAVMIVASSIKPPPEEKANQYTIAQADQAWTLDPFFKLAPVKEQTKETVSEQDVASMMDGEIGLNYTGYIMAGGRILAIINGVEYQAGEQITESGLTIVSISKEDVVIGKEGSSAKKVIPLEQTEF